MSHRLTKSHTSLFVLGQYITSLALRLHFSMPRCPSCTSDRISGRIFIGMTIRWPFSSTPSTTVKSSTNVAYGLGHAFGSSIMLRITCLMTSSFSVSSAISFHFRFETGSSAFTAHTCISTSSSVVLGTSLGEKALDSVSAITRCLPGV